MTPSLMPFRVRHVIPDEEICERVGILMNALVVGGMDPADIDLTDLAMKFVMRDLTYEALEAGVSLGTGQWSIAPKGDAEVIFPVERQEEAVMFKLRVG